jgi:hypothetical protein
MEKLAAVLETTRFSEKLFTAEDTESTETRREWLGNTLGQLLKRPEVTIEQFVVVLRRIAPNFFERELRVHYEPAKDAPMSLYEEMTGVFSHAERSEGSTPDPDNSVVIALPPRSGFRDVSHSLPAEVRNELKSIETEIKYAGYLDQQRKSIERLKKAEQRAIPEWFDYANVSGLSREMKEKLQRVRPRTLAQASRIPGVTPAAVSLVNVYIEIQGKRRTVLRNCETAEVFVICRQD